MLIPRSWRSSNISKAFQLIPRSDRIKVGSVIALQIVMSGIDLVAVALIGVLGSLTVSGISSETPGTRVSKVLSIFHLEGKPFQFQAAVIGAFAVTLLISRTIISISFTRRTLHFLARRSSNITSDLLGKLLTQPLLMIQQRSSQQTLYALTTGVSSIALGIIGTTVSVVSDFALISILTIGLFVLDPVISFVTFLTFSLIGYALYRLLHLRAFKLGNEQSELEIRSNEKILEVLNTYREATVRNRRSFYATEISKQRSQLSQVQAELSFMPNISKYVIETTVVIGALILSAIQFLTQDATHAVASLAIFMAAGMRIAPAGMRLQQGALQVRITVGISSPTFSIIESLTDLKPAPFSSALPNFKYDDFDPAIEFKDVSLTYPGKPVPAVSSVSLRIKAGSVVAIVGPSGSGKTTLVDLMLGIIESDSGDIRISNHPPKKAIEKWSGGIAYVPQDVVIMDTNVSKNVALGYSYDPSLDTRIRQALEVAQLSDFVSSLPDGLDTTLGERGSRMSGGQRQRLGIARAIFTAPKLLVLDEATSALDGQTEAAVSSAINSLKGSTTVVLIAHRLTTVLSADKVVYLENGKIRAEGSFEDVRKQVPEFDKQARLIGD